MIKYNPKTWFILIFHSYSRHVLRTLLPAMFMIGLFTLGFTYLVLDYLRVNPTELHSTTVVHTLLGVVLGLFLVFRVNSAYDRWWEGRKMWGSMVNSSRNLAIKLNAFISQENHEDRDWFSKMIANFVYASKEHLRKGVQFAELEPVSETFIEDLKKNEHRPARLSAMIYEKVNRLYKKGEITGDHLINLDKEITEFMDIVGSCERIKNTPIPYSYSMYIKKFLFIYITTLPFGLIIAFEYFTIAAVLLVSFILLSVELIAEEIEDPFGNDINDLPTDELAGKIREEVKEIFQV